MCTVSSGFNSVARPINDGITIAENAVNSPKLKMMKFFAVAAKICLGDEWAEKQNKKCVTIWRRKLLRACYKIYAVLSVYFAYEIRIVMVIRRKIVNLTWIHHVFLNLKPNLLTCGKMRRNVLISWISQFSPFFVMICFSFTNFPFYLLSNYTMKQN